MIELAQLKRIVEAALLAAAQPLTVAQLLALFGDEELPSHDQVAQALDQLRQDSEDRGIELVEVASGFRYQVRQAEHHWVARLWTERQTRYSRALLETLALIAYRQPITRAEIEQIRGVAVSTNIIKTLEEREWVRVVGYRDVPGKPAIYGTNRNFLDYFNLKSLDQLPPLADIHDIDDLDPQLLLGPASAAPLAMPVELIADADAEAAGLDEAADEPVKVPDPSALDGDAAPETADAAAARDGDTDDSHVVGNSPSTAPDTTAHSSPDSAAHAVPAETDDAPGIAPDTDIAVDATSLPPTSESVATADAADDDAATPEQPA